ncbi:hypothetical protein [Qipengyuania flava]|uniref:hypothetical protein n=1 Tax=Qipengyuania flava TaxID=192812 RepID=UPI001C634D57|nr:hypothetical protein [Qipengyuania flava]QYJ07573.1 hypothetical protein KUV82_02285 [Qipengyuania flava]
MRAVAALLALALGACAANQSPRDPYQRILSSAPGAAQPSRIYAREIAMLREAREQGEAAARLDFAAPSAQLLTAAGAQAAATALPSTTAGVSPWAPGLIWMSCDSRLAVSQGRYETPEGQVGSYVTSWQRERDGTYRWLHTASVLDDPQPVRTPAETPDDPNAIVVPGIPSIDGRVTDCTRPESGAPARHIDLQEMRSPDGTLSWRWGYEGSTRLLRVYAFTEGAWRRVIDERWPAPQG